MKLTIKERVTIVALYPRESDLITQVLVKDLKEKIKLSQEEIKEIELKKEGMGYVWNTQKAKNKDIDFTKMEIIFLKEQVDRLDKEKKISLDLIDICLKIREGEKSV